MSIRMRLTLMYSSILAISIIMLGTMAYFFFANNLSNNLDDTLKETSRRVLREITVPFYPLSYVRLPDVNVFSSSGIYVQIVNHRGQVEQKSRNLGRQVLPLGEYTWEQIQQRKTAFETLQVDVDGAPQKQKLRVYSVPLIVEDSGTFIGLLQVGSSLAPIEEALSEFRFLLVIGAFLSILLSGSAGWFLAGKSLQPIGRLIRETSGIQAGADLGRRIDNPGPKDEIYELTETINRMLARLEDAYRRLDTLYQAQKQFVADASHELRTPLTSIRGNIDLLRKMGTLSEGTANEIVEDIADESERMSRLISDLLVLARADAGYRLEKKKQLLQPIMQDVLKSASFIPREVEFRRPDLGAVKGVLINGHADFLKQLFLILLENAFKYTQEGYVAMDLHVRRSTREWIVTIEDTGIGMSREETRRVFERFYRADAARSRTGTGLGLAMAKWIVDQHEGDIIVSSEPGKGTTLIVKLPLPEDAVNGSEG